MDRVVHFEIPVDNMTRAEKFYQTVFGWKINIIPLMKYTLVYTTPVDDKQMHMEKGAINGGMLQRQAPITSPVITIGVKNIDLSIKSLEKSGGKIVKPKFQVGDMGLSAYCKDTEGNIIGLWQELKH